MKKIILSFISTKLFIIVDAMFMHIVLISIMFTWLTEKLLHKLVPVEEIWGKPYEPIIGSGEYKPLFERKKKS